MVLLSLVFLFINSITNRPESLRVKSSNLWPCFVLKTKKSAYDCCSVEISPVGIAVHGWKMYGLDLTAARNNMSHCSDVN